jgi:hypothetical protein
MISLEEIRSEFKKMFEEWAESDPQKKWLLSKQSTEFRSAIRLVAFRWFCEGIYAERGIKPLGDGKTIKPAEIKRNEQESINKSEEQCPVCGVWYQNYHKCR